MLEKYLEKHFNIVFVSCCALLVTGLVVTGDIMFLLSLITIFIIPLYSVLFDNGEFKKENEGKTNSLPDIFWIEREYNGKIYRQTTQLRWNNGSLEQLFICHEDADKLWLLVPQFKETDNG